MIDSDARLRVDGIQVHVRVDGQADGRSLLLLHGLTDAVHYYRRVISRLSDRYRVVSLDFRGHGRSDRAESYATRDFVTDAVAACQRVAGAGSHHP